MRGARTLNKVSRSLSEVGRTPSQSGAFRRLPLYRPAMIRTLPYFNQSELLLPSPLREFQEVARQSAFLNQCPRIVVCGFHDVAIAHEIARAQPGQPGLPRAEKVTGTTQLEIALRDREPIGRGRHRL